MAKPRVKKDHSPYLSRVRRGPCFEIRIGPGTSYKSLLEEIERCKKETTDELVWHWELHNVFGDVGFVGIGTLPGFAKKR